MPVIVVGADTDSGQAILKGLQGPDREVRAFVSDETIGVALKSDGFKVALGDVSDESHVEAATARCFSAVLVTEAATDSRERSFAETPREVVEAWARAVAASDVTRVIWVSADRPPATKTREVATLDPGDPNLVEKVVELDDAQTIS